MRPLYAQLKMQHYSANESRPAMYLVKRYLMRLAMTPVRSLNQIGYMNTCAVRMSLALLKCNVSFSGRLPIKAGAYKGKRLNRAPSYWPTNCIKITCLGKLRFIRRYVRQQRVCVIAKALSSLIE